MQELDLQTISVIVAAMSVVVGVIMSVLSIRNLAKSRRASIFLDFHKQADQEFLESLFEVVGEWSWGNYEQFMAKYGPTASRKDWAKFVHVSSFFDSMGKLLEVKITDAELIPEAMAVIAMAWWEKIEPIQTKIAGRWRTSESIDSSKFLYETLKKLGYRSPVPGEQEDPSLTRQSENPKS
ncbi:MAG: hypothetical protein JSW61_08815 [Candidatus Thorarchaeota archaeon]|nr:MAG: hypothetical protein JSW61_08815 [Candidatus Thorarchaeota archaeon]